MPKKSGLYLSSELDTFDATYARSDLIKQTFGSQILARYRAESLLPYLADGAALTAWRDESQYANHLGAGAAAPLFQTDGGPNGYPRVEFETASSQYMVLASAPIVTTLSGSDVPFTCVAVVNVESVALGAFFGLGHSTGQGLRVYGVHSAGNDWRWRNKDDAALGLNVTATAADYATGTWYVASCVFPGTTVSMYRSGTPAASATATNVATATFDSLGVGAVNNIGTFDSFLDGDLAEVIVFDTALTGTNRRLVESTLAKKYGITLDA